MKPFLDHDSFPDAERVLLLQSTGSWAGVDARELMQQPDVVVARIRHRDLVSMIEGQFSYIGTAHWQGDFWVVLRVPEPEIRTWLALKFDTIPPGQLPRMSIPHEKTST